MRPNLIAAYWPGKCKACNATYPEGARVWYAGKGSGCRCQSCGPHGQQAPPPLPAPSAAGAPTRSTRAADYGDIQRQSFDSLSDLVSFALDHHVADSQHNLDRIAAWNSGGWGNEFFNYYHVERFRRELDAPPAALLAAIDDMRQQITDDIPAPLRPRRRIIRNQEQGDELDPDRFIARDPAAWSRMTRTAQPAHVAMIGANVVVSGFCSSSDLLYRGAAALALADVLQARGASVEIVGLLCVKDPSDDTSLTVTRCTIKPAHQPADIGTLAMALCEIATARAAFIPAMLRSCRGNILHGYGSPAALPAADRAGIDYLAEQSIRSRAEAVEWLMACLARSTAA